MAAHPLTTSRVRTFVEAIAEWAEAMWATTVDIPFIIVGCTNRSLIFDLRLRMDLPDRDLVFMTDLVVGRIRQWEGSDCAIVQRQSVVWTAALNDITWKRRRDGDAA